MSKPSDEPAYPVVGRCSECDGKAFTDEGYCRHCDGIGHLHEGGLTKRELFAAMAMQGLLAAQAGKQCEDCLTEDHLAAIAAHQADALLAELAKEATQ